MKKLLTYLSKNKKSSSNFMSFGDINIRSVQPVKDKAITKSGCLNLYGYIGPQKVNLISGQSFMHSMFIRDVLLATEGEGIFPSLIYNHGGLLILEWVSGMNVGARGVKESHLQEKMKSFFLILERYKVFSNPTFTRQENFLLPRFKKAVEVLGLEDKAFSVFRNFSCADKSYVGDIRLGDMSVDNFLVRSNGDLCFVDLEYLSTYFSPMTDYVSFFLGGYSSVWGAVAAEFKKEICAATATEKKALWSIFMMQKVGQAFEAGKLNQCNHLLNRSYNEDFIDFL